VKNMDNEKIIITVDEINDFVRTKMWLDFEVLNYDKYKLTVIGSIDISTAHDIEITFEDISFVSMPFEWKTDTSNKALVFVEGEEAIAINRRFQVEKGYHIFRIIPEDFPEDFGCYLGAKSISYQISKQ
jgi:hypothetical protein